MTVLVTGGTGFVGGAIVGSLLKRGQPVRVLARPTSKTEHLEELGVEIARGDVFDQASVETALDGCETLYHAAALYDFWTLDKAQMLQTAKQGTRHVLEVALNAGVNKVIYTSSTVALGERKGETATEATQHRGFYLSTYDRAKAEAEQIARTHLDKGLPLIVVSPAGVYGPGDFKPTGRGIINIINRKSPLLFPMVFSVVYIDDAGEGHVLAAEQGQVGERYILTGDVTTTDDWFGPVCDLAGVRMPPKVPGFFFYPLAYGGELLARFTRKPPLLPVDHLRFLLHGNRSDGSKVVRELGLTYTPLVDGLRAAILWYWEQGFLKKKPACADAS